jgi:very-short-patch-repair endonuclease
MRGALTANNARALRKRMTDAEQLLWRNLRSRTMSGMKFRRQHCIGSFIADFACVEKKLIIEVDGGQHAENANQDADRTAYLNSQGWTVMRFWNNEVLQATEAVLEAIFNAIK